MKSNDHSTRKFLDAAEEEAPSMKVRTPWCPVCKSRGEYDEVFDAAYCRGCNAWIEEKCGDSDCSYCKDRPLVPRI